MNQLDITENVFRFECERHIVEILENYQSWIIRWDFSKSEHYFEEPIQEWLKDHNINVKISHQGDIRILVDFESTTDMIHFKLKWL